MCLWERREEGVIFGRPFPPLSLSLTKGFLKKREGEEEENGQLKNPKREAQTFFFYNTRDDDGSLCGKMGGGKRRTPSLTGAMAAFKSCCFFLFFLSLSLSLLLLLYLEDIPGKRVFFFLLYFTLLYLTCWNGIFQINFVGQDENGRI